MSIAYRPLDADWNQPTTPRRGYSPFRASWGTHPRSGFDEAFRKLCLRFDVVASYVLIDDVTDDGRARLLAGGNAALCSELRERLGDQTR